MTFDIIEAVRLEHLKGNKPNYIIEIEEGANIRIFAPSSIIYLILLIASRGYNLE